MSRITRIVLLAVIALFTAAPAASAVPSKKLDDYLAALWTTVLETPDAQNPYGSGGPASACLDLGGTVAPLGPSGAESCTVKPGTRIFVAGWTTECSTFEGDDCGGTNEAELRANARAADAGITVTVTLDGKPVPVAEVETPLLNIVLPADNIFGLPAGTQGLSIGHGWVALLHPLIVSDLSERVGCLNGEGDPAVAPRKRGTGSGRPGDKGHNCGEAPQRSRLPAHPIAVVIESVGVTPAYGHRSSDVAGVMRIF